MNDNRWGRRVALAVAMVALAGLLGCSLLGEPTSTETLLVRFAANPNNDNFVAEATADVAVAVSGYRKAIPVAANLEAGGGSAHGSIVVDTTDFDEEGSRKSYELYVEQQDNAIIWYLGEQDGDAVAWRRSEVDLSFVPNIPTLVDLLSNATFLRIAYESDERVCYELELPAWSVAETVLGMGEVTTSFGDVDERELRDVLGNSKVHVRFTKDCLIRSVSLDLDFEHEDKDLFPVPATIDLDFEAVLDKHGSVDPASVAVPREVRAQDLG